MDLEWMYKGKYSHPGDLGERLSCDRRWLTEYDSPEIHV